MRVNKSEFLKILETKTKQYLGESDKSLTSWWLVMKDLSEIEFNKEYKKEFQK